VAFSSTSSFLVVHSHRYSSADVRCHSMRGYARSRNKVASKPNKFCRYSTIRTQRTLPRTPLVGSYDALVSALASASENTYMKITISATGATKADSCTSFLEVEVRGGGSQSPPSSIGVAGDVALSSTSGILLGCRSRLS